MSTILFAGLAIVLLSAMCSLAEAAFLSLPLVRARALAKLGGPAARVVLRLRERVQNAITALVILNTVVNMVGASIVGAAVSTMEVEARAAGGTPGVVLAVAVPALTAAVIVFGEIIPKALGERFHTGVSLAAAFPVLGLVALFRPVVWAAERGLGLVVPARSRTVTSEEEISALAQQAEKEGAIDPGEAEVIQRVFRLNDFTAEDIMTPRIRCRMLPEDSTLGEARAELAAIGYARIPVFAGTRDNVTGVIRRADALLGLADGKVDLRLSELATRAKFVPGTMTVDRLLFELQRSRVQLGIVVGEYGETIGVATVEDIVEELVGEILDEKDVDEYSIKRISRTEILVHGQTEVGRINHFFNTELNEDRPTVSGLLLETLGRLPRVGERVPMDGVELVADEVNDRAIVRVRVLKSVDGAGSGRARGSAAAAPSPDGASPAK